MNNYISNFIQSKQRQYDLEFAPEHASPAAIDGILEYENIPYHIDGKPAHTMTIYRPEYRPDPLPVVLHIHGGGLIAGKLQHCRRFCAALAGQGLLVCSMDYRLVPEVTFFQQLEDVFSAMDSIDVTVGQYGGESGSLYLVGEGAGALLSYYACAIQYCPFLAVAANISPSLLPIEKMALISGMYYTAKGSPIGKLLSPSYFGQEYRKSAFYPYLDPGAIEVCNSISPALLITSGKDILRSHTYRLSKTMKRHNLPYLLRDYGSNPSIRHAFPVRHSFLSQSKEAIEEIGTFFTTGQNISIDRPPHIH